MLTSAGKITASLIIFLATLAPGGFAQAESGDASDSVARRWNELTLESIRNDFARPIVHARNLFHISAAAWDAWAAYDATALPWLVDVDVEATKTSEEDRRIAVSYAMFRILKFRFRDSPGFPAMSLQYDALMNELGLDPSLEDDGSDSAAAIGVRIANAYIIFGIGDGSNEVADYANQFYEPINEPLVPPVSGTQGVEVPDRWQPLSLEFFVDQSGNVVVEGYPEFLGPEWGNVTPFSLANGDRTLRKRDGRVWSVYLDPGSPPSLATGDENVFLETFETTLRWSAHLDPADGVFIDVSPNSIGNATLPDDVVDFAGFYDLEEGGDAGVGYQANPVTGAPYPTQFVPRADYARILAEFWADGPDSETPPGHWFTILNDVVDHPDFERRLGGVGPELDPLEFDVKVYFGLGGCMHDASIAAWSVKGYYDYARPISAIRWMAENGQRTDAFRASFHPQGLRLVPGLVEEITLASTAPGERHEHLAGPDGENVGRIAAFCWRGPAYIEDPASDVAGCGWILAEDWWPYQRPTFVTPNFAGYVSGHSTYSRAAAEFLTSFTGSPYFPGGLGEYLAPAQDFLVFENGPSVEVRLQWASYRDASDQCSLSRIWGGIHPWVDDLPGRLMGREIGIRAFDHAATYFGPTSDCVADLNGDGLVDAADLGILFAQWGCTRKCEADLNGSGEVEAADLGFLIAEWGPDCGG